MMKNAAGAHGRLEAVLYVDGNSSYVWADDQLTDNLDGQSMADVLDIQSGIRAALGAALNNIGAQAEVLMDDYAEAIERTAVDADQAWQQVYEYMVDANIRVRSRNWTFGTASAAASNTGTGTIRRLTKDKYDQDIEAGFSDQYTFRCVADAGSAQVQNGQEVFIGESLPLGADDLHPEGQGIAQSIVAANAQDSTAFLNNPSFDATQVVLSGGSLGTSAGAAQSIVGYSITNPANVKVVSYSTYRTFQGEAAPGALLMKGDATVAQVFNANINRPFNRLTPYYLQVAYNRAGLSATSATAGAAIKMRLGSLTHTLTTSTESGWNIHTIALDDSCWYDNWAEDNASLRLEVSGLSAGGILLDDIVLTPMTLFADRYVAVVGGATPFSVNGNSARGDRFDFADTIGASNAYTQGWLNARGWYLPASATPASYTEPSI